MSSTTCYKLVLPAFLVTCFLLIVMACNKKSSDANSPAALAVVTAQISAITSTTAISGGNVTSDGGSRIAARGVCWSTLQNPTLSDTHTSDSSGTGSYTSNITGLASGTTYFLRAFATNQNLTAYGSQLTFKTSAPLQIPTITTAVVSNIGPTSATSGGNVTIQGSTTVTARGICWNLSGNPNISNPHTTDGTGTGSFASNMTGLTPDSVYFLKAYATNSIGTGYGTEVSFTSLGQPPILTTAPITNVTQTSATGGGNVTAQGSFPVTSRGVCWSISPNPTVSGYHTTDGAGTGNFTSSITGLSPNTFCYVRSYATSSCGTGYGDQVTFTSAGISTLPTVVLSEIINITTNSATTGGTIISDGGAPVTIRGVCWSSTPNPSLTDNYTTDGSGSGTYTSEINGLIGETIYYVKAYATNSSGTGYGTQITFSTLSSFTCGDTVNYSGQVYHSLMIGSQCWLKENLNIGTRVEGSQNQTDNGIIEKYCYLNLDSNCNIYGGLYQWAEMMQYSNDPPLGKGICPNGWHLPTDDEYDALINAVGGSYLAGGKLKEDGIAHWNAPNTAATNSSGFTALPAGYLHAGNQSHNESLNLYLWTRPKYNSTQCWTRRFDYNSGAETRVLMNRVDGMSARCVKN